MRYAVFSDIHANLEALEAVLAKIDELSRQEPIDKIWFLGDLVGYGPNPNECIEKLRERTDIIIAGNHDWAAVGKIDLEDFSPMARISAEWTARQLTGEHRDFLANLPERLEFGEVTLVHGSPYGPLWEYLTSEILAERSFQYFNTRYCFVGHTHVPIIFQQPDDIANIPTTPLLNGMEQNGKMHAETRDEQYEPAQEGAHNEEKEVAEKVAVLPSAINAQVAGEAASSYADPATGLPLDEQEADILLEKRRASGEANHAHAAVGEDEAAAETEGVDTANEETNQDNEETEELSPLTMETEKLAASPKEHAGEMSSENNEAETQDLPDGENSEASEDEEPAAAETDVVEIAPGTIIIDAEEDLLNLYYLSQSLAQATNEMSVPPEGSWQAKEGYRAIINPGGVGQPRDGDNRAAFMIYDTERGFEFYRVSYAIHKTQEKIIKAGLPSYLAARLAFGR
ncbi:MAG TPA: metallophosphoesterase [Ktedonobacteraceae bacterium]|nr:metallophosphoesterase [Ktedonobacteraceae bacterium]